MNNRIEWIDQAKGIGILLVVLGHMNIPITLSTIIFSFHMPLFFLLSGIVFNEIKYSKDFKTVLLAKSSTLLWPFFTFTLLSILLNVITGNIPAEPVSNYLIHSLHLSIFAIDSIDTPLWFLTALMSTEILFSQILRYTNLKHMIILLVIIFGTIGIINAYYFHYRLLLNLHIGLIALLFFSIGWFLKHSKIINFIINNKKIFLLLIVSFSLTILFALSNVKVDMHDNSYGNFILFLFASLFGIYSIIALSHLTVHSHYLSTFLKYVGKNSLIILSVHVIFPPIVVHVIGSLPYRLDRFISILLIWISIELINRYATILLNIRRKY